MTRDDDDWVGTPPEGRHPRSAARPEHWRGSWQMYTIVMGILGFLVLIVVLLAAL